MWFPIWSLILQKFNKTRGALNHSRAAQNTQSYEISATESGKCFNLSLSVITLKKKTKLSTYVIFLKQSCKKQSI